MATPRTTRFARLLLLGALLLALAPAASAQCAMCYNAAAAQNAKSQKALDAGIFILASPVLLLAGGVVFIAYKRRNAPDEPSGDPGASGEPDSLAAPLIALPPTASSDGPRPSA